MVENIQNILIKCVYICIFYFVKNKKLMFFLIGLLFDQNNKLMVWRCEEKYCKIKVLDLIILCN